MITTTEQRNELIQRLEVVKRKLLEVEEAMEAIVVTPAYKAMEEAERVYWAAVKMYKATPQYKAGKKAEKAAERAERGVEEAVEVCRNTPEYEAMVVAKERLEEAVSNVEATPEYEAYERVCWEFICDHPNNNHTTVDDDWIFEDIQRKLVNV